MQWPLRILIFALAGALALPMVLPVAADGDDGDGGDDGRRPGDGNGGSTGAGDDGGESEDTDDRESDDDDGRDKDRADDETQDGEGKSNKDEKGKEREGKDDEKDEDKDKDAKKEGKGRGRDGDERGHGEDKGERDDNDADHQDGSDREPSRPAAGGGNSPVFPLHATSDRADVRVSQDYDISPGVLTYTFRIANNGGATARDVQLDGELPDVGSWVLTDPLHCDLATDGDVDCDLGDLAGGEAIEVEARSVLVGEVPSFTNVVQVYTPVDQA